LNAGANCVRALRSRREIGCAGPEACTGRASPIGNRSLEVAKNRAWLLLQRLNLALDVGDITEQASALLRLEIAGHRLGHILAQVDQPVVEFAAHQQRPAIGALLQVVAVGSLDLDRPQSLEAEQGQDGSIAQRPFLTIGRSGTEQEGQLDLGQVAEVSAAFFSRGARTPTTGLS